MSTLDVVSKDFGRTTELRFEIERSSFVSEYLIKTLQRAAELVAERYVKENYAEIAKHIDPQAVANLAMAQAAKQVCEAQIKAQPPRVVQGDSFLIRDGLFSTSVSKL